MQSFKDTGMLNARATFAAARSSAEAEPLGASDYQMQKGRRCRTLSTIKANLYLFDRIGRQSDVNLKSIPC